MPKKKNKAQKTVEKISKNKYYVTFVVLMFLIIVVAAYFYRKQSAGMDSVGTESFSGQTVVETDAVRDLKITYIDVGQGDAVWIELPDGKNMLVDSGDRPTENREKLDRVLSSEGVAKKIDYLVATHPDSDHIGQMSYIYEKYEVGMTFRPFVKSEKAEADAFEGTFNDGISIGNETAVYYSFLDAVRKEGTPWTFFYDGSDICGTAVVGDTEYVYEIDFMMPHALSLADYTKDNPNNFSAIFMLRYAGRNFLFTGDIGNQSTAKRNVEKIFADAYRDNAQADCDVLKVAHHGSESSSSAEFLNAVTPDYAVISCGLENKYKHPTREAIDRLIVSNAKILRTDLQGNVVFTVDSEGRMTCETQTSANDAYIFEDYFTVVDLIGQGKIVK